MLIKFKEYAKGELENKEIENDEKQYLPCVILVDTSGSMANSMTQLHDGLTALSKALKERSQALGYIDCCIIVFDDYARIVVPFGPIYDYEIPKLDCGGLTAMHAAVDMALEEIEYRKSQYKANQATYLRPWIFMMTDGGANDIDNGAFERLIESQQGRHCIFFPVGIGDKVDIGLLKTLRLDGKVLTASKENFKNAFVCPSKSLIQTSRPKTNGKVTLLNSNDFQLEIES